MRTGSSADGHTVIPAHTLFPQTGYHMHYALHVLGSLLIIILPPFFCNSAPRDGTADGGLKPTNPGRVLNVVFDGIHGIGPTGGMLGALGLCGNFDIVRHFWPVLSSIITPHGAPCDVLYAVPMRIGC